MPRSRIVPFVPLLAAGLASCYAAAPLDEAALLREIRQTPAGATVAARPAAQAPSAPLTEADAIARADAGNPFLRAERARVPEAAAEVRKARRLENPEVRVSNGWEEDGAYSEDRFTLDFRWSPDPLPQHLAEIDIAKAAVPESRAEAALRAWEIRKEVRLAWTRAAWGRLRAAVDEERAAVRRETRDRLAGAPGSDPVERLRAEVAAADAEDRARRRLEDEQEALRELARLLGLPSADGLSVLPPDDPAACPSPPADPAARIEVAARSHPRVALARAAYGVSEAELKLEYARRAPWARFIQIGWGYLPRVDDGIRNDRNRLRIGAALDLPILDWNQGGVAAGEARRNRRALQFREALTDVVGGVDSSMRRWTAAAERLDRLRAGAPATAQRTVTLTREAVQAGRLSSLDLARSRLDALDLREALVEAALSCREAAIEAEAALGTPIEGDGTN